MRWKSTAALNCQFHYVSHTAVFQSPESHAGRVCSVRMTQDEEGVLSQNEKAEYLFFPV